MTSNENRGSPREPRPRRILTSTGARRSTGPWTASAELESALADYRRTRQRLIAGGATLALAVVALPLLLVGAFMSLRPAGPTAPVVSPFVPISTAALVGERDSLAVEKAALAERQEQLEARLAEANSERHALAEHLESAEGTILALRSQFEKEQDALDATRLNLAHQQEQLEEAERSLETRERALLVAQKAATPTAPSWTASIAPLWTEQVTAYRELATRREELSAAWAQTRGEHAAELHWIEEAGLNAEADALGLRRRAEQLDEFLARPLPLAPQLPQVAGRVDSTNPPEPILNAFRELHRTSLAQAQALQEADSTLALLERQLTALEGQRLAAQAAPSPAFAEGMEPTLAVVRTSPPVAATVPTPPASAQAQWPMNALPLREWDYRTHMSEFANGMTYTFRVPERGGERVVPFIPYDGWRELIDRQARRGLLDRAAAERLREYPAFEKFALSLPALQEAGLYVARSVQFRWEP